MSERSAKAMQLDIIGGLALVVFIAIVALAIYLIKK